MSLTYLDDDRVNDLAQELFVSLTEDLPAVPTIDLTSPDFEYEPDLDSALYGDTDPVTIEMLTEGVLEGGGVFDKMMSAIDLHIQREFKGNRISGDQYATVYGGAIAVIMDQAVKFTLTKDQAKWAAITAQMAARAAEIQAVTARVILEKTKFEAATAQYLMQNTKATVALTKMELANANGQHLLLMSQVEEQRYKVTELLPITKNQQSYSYATLMLDQHKLLAEQLESERSKTLNTRTDGTVIVGQVGKQKDLVDEQIDSFIKDAKFKTAKLYFDGFITQYTINDLTDIPDQLVKTEIDEVLASNRTYVGL